MKLTSASFTKRALIVGLITGGGILAASSFAMSSDGPTDRGGCEARHGQKHPGHGNFARWEEKRSDRMAALKEKLKLKPDQEAAWNTFMGAAQLEMRHARADRQAMRSELEKLDTPQRLDRMLAVSESRRAKMLERTQAIKAFYSQLTPEQQSVFDAETTQNRHPQHHRHHVSS